MFGGPKACVIQQFLCILLYKFYGSILSTVVLLKILLVAVHLWQVWDVWHGLLSYEYCCNRACYYIMRCLYTCDRCGTCGVACCLLSMVNTLVVYWAWNGVQLMLMLSSPALMTTLFMFGVFHSITGMIVSARVNNILYTGWCCYKYILVTTQYYTLWLWYSKV